MNNPTLFVGIDAHQEEHSAVALSGFDEKRGQFCFANDREGIDSFLSWLADLKSSLVLAIEGGGNTRHALLVELTRHGHEVYEVNPLLTKNRRRFTIYADKSDLGDAEAIAQVLIRKKDLPRIRTSDLSPKRLCLKKLVWFYEDVTKRGARIKVQLASLKREWELSQDQEAKKLLAFIIGNKEKDLAKIKELQKKLEKKLSLYLEKEGGNLTTMRGISTILAAKIVAHSGGVGRFHSLNAFIRYGGLSPREQSSGKRQRHVKSRRGNRRLNSAFYLASLSQLVWNVQAREYFEKKVKEGKSKKHALRCLMKRTACIVYGILKSGEAYRG
jgi:transposase